MSERIGILPLFLGLQLYECCRRWTFHAEDCPRMRRPRMRDDKTYVMAPPPGKSQCSCGVIIAGGPTGVTIPTAELAEYVRAKMESLSPEAAFRARVGKLLREIEWTSDGENDNACPKCRGTEHSGGDRHEPDCELAAILKECGA